MNAGGLGGLSSLLTPEVLGGLAGALFSGKGRGQTGGGSLGSSFGGSSQAGLGGAGLGALGGLLTSLLSGGLGGGGDNGIAAPAGGFAPSQAAPAVTRDKVQRFIRALVYAAKADGHIDDQEQAAIDRQMTSLNIGSEGRAMVRAAIDETLDPKRVADGVTDSQEALQLFALSCAAINIDHFMEKSYLDALADALRIPANVKMSIESKIAGR